MEGHKRMRSLAAASLSLASQEYSAIVLMLNILTGDAVVHEYWLLFQAGIGLTGWFSVSSGLF